MAKEVNKIIINFYIRLIFIGSFCRSNLNEEEKLFLNVLFESNKTHFAIYHVENILKKHNYLKYSICSFFFNSNKIYLLFKYFY